MTKLPGRAIAGPAGLLVASLATCRGTPTATFELDVPPALAREAAWYEVAVFANGCPAVTILSGGIPPEGTFSRLAFAASSANPPGLGDLPTQSYGIAAVARAADCSVLGTGCVAQGLGSGTLTLSITPVSGTPAGACEEGSICEEAECVPDVDAGNGETDGAANPLTSEACTLTLLGQGPLADPLGAGSTLLSAPAIAATPAGFLLAYREFDPVAGAARLTTIALDPSGAAASPVQTPLLDVCAGSPETDATALTFSGSQGTIALSRAACSDGPDGGSTLAGLVIATLDETGSIQESSFTTEAGGDVTLGQGHALASTAGGTLLAYTDAMSQASFAATVTGTSVGSSPVAFSGFGAGSNTAAYVAGSSAGAAFVAITAPSGSAPLAVIATQPKGSGVGKGSTLAARWASASATGSRVLVASNGSGGTGAIAWSAFDMGTRDAVQSGTFYPATIGEVFFVDVAADGDHAYFAAAIDQSISLFAFERASTEPQMLGELPFASHPGIPLGMLRDGLVSVAASGGRVAVVWGTGSTLGSDDSVGGYAVFACVP